VLCCQASRLPRDLRNGHLAQVSTQSRRLWRNRSVPSRCNAPEGIGSPRKSVRGFPCGASWANIGDNEKVTTSISAAEYRVGSGMILGLLACAQDIEPKRLSAERSS